MTAQKTKTTYVCQSCGAIHSKWQGQCSSCLEWNTIAEEITIKKTKQKISVNISKPILLEQISNENFNRLIFSNAEVNRVLGGGVVPGTLILVAGEPGIGKSTLLLELALTINNTPVLYISGEESAQQIKLRADRLGINNPLCHIYCETNIENIINQANNLKPGFLIIDSIQTIYTSAIESATGSVGQVRESTALLQQYAKQHNIPVFIIGHVTKEGYIAGPKLLEHMVDTVLYFEGERHYGYRILRAIKNRFGSTAELGIFEMTHKGLREVLDPSELFITHSEEKTSGVSIASVIEGLRPFMIEVQALSGTAAYGQPQRSATGFDNRRLSMLLAVLEKKVGFKLGQKDIFLNITGGVKIDDPAMDLSVIASIASSYVDIPIDKQICFAGEIGLSGEIRPVYKLEQRISEAEKMQYKKIVISKYNVKQTELNPEFTRDKIEIITSSKITDVFKILFG